MEYSSSNLISFVYKNWKPLVVIPFLSMVVAVVFSGPTFIKPLFESQVILFPSTTNSVSKALLPQTNGYGDEDIFEYGDEQQAEQLLQILSSGEIRDSVIAKFDFGSEGFSSIDLMCCCPSSSITPYRCGSFILYPNIVAPLSFRFGIMCVLINLLE